MKSDKVVLRELNYLKIIGILLVVIGHCTSIYTGGWVFTSPVNSPIYALIASYIYISCTNVSICFRSNLLLLQN